MNMLIPLRRLGPGVNCSRPKSRALDMFRSSIPPAVAKRSFLDEYVGGLPQLIRHRE